MSSRSAFEHAGLALAVANEAVWCAALASALTGASWALFFAFAAVTVGAAAAVARWARGGDNRRSAALAVEVAVILAAAVVLVIAGRAWSQLHPVWQSLQGFVFSTGLAVLGAVLGRAAQTPEGAVRRAARAFALLCAVLLAAAADGQTPAWAAVAVVVSVASGGLLVAVVRYRALTEQVAESDRLRPLPWLLAVAGAILGVLAAGALLGQLFEAELLQDALRVAGAALKYALAALGWLVGWAGGLLVRAADALLSAFDLEAGPLTDLPTPQASPPVFEVGPATEGSTTVRFVLMVAAAVAAVALAGLLVALALRRFRPETAAAEGVAEEREALTSFRTAARRYAAGVGRRLRRRLATLRPREPSTPAELVRRRYAELERRLAREGLPRAPGVTVRDHLAAVATGPADGGAHPWPTGAEPARDAADLAGLYELARYSAHAVDAAQARRFEALARGFAV